MLAVNGFTLRCIFHFVQGKTGKIFGEERFLFATDFSTLTVHSGGGFDCRLKIFTEWGLSP